MDTAAGAADDDRLSKVAALVKAIDTHHHRTIGELHRALYSARGEYDAADRTWRPPIVEVRSVTDRHLSIGIAASITELPETAEGGVPLGSRCLTVSVSALHRTLRRAMPADSAEAEAWARHVIGLDRASHAYHRPGLVRRKNGTPAALYFMLYLDDQNRPQPAPELEHQPRGSAELATTTTAYDLVTIGRLNAG